MNFIRVFIATFAGLLLSGLPQTALAQCSGSVCTTPRQRYVRKAAVVETVVEPVIAATFVPVAVAVPQYSVGPYPTGYAPQTTPAPELEALKAELAKLRAQVEAARKAQAEAPKAAAPEPTATAPSGLTHLSVFGAKCAACHSQKSAAGKGGVFVLLKDDKTLAALNDTQVRKLVADVYSGRMPKKGEKLTDPEVGAVMDWVAGMK
jgi:mono/diheme cytochrome c family protein